MDAQTKIEVEAAAFRRLQHHLITKRPDVQNIDLMNQSGFCRAFSWRYSTRRGQSGQSRGASGGKGGVIPRLYRSPGPRGSRPPSSVIPAVS